MHHELSSPRRHSMGVVGRPPRESQIGKMLVKDLPAAFPEAATLEVLLLGQCTTNYLPPVVTAWAWSEGLRVKVRSERCWSRICLPHFRKQPPLRCSCSGNAPRTIFPPSSQHGRGRKASA